MKYCPWPSTAPFVVDPPDACKAPEFGLLPAGTQYLVVDIETIRDPEMPAPEVKPLPDGVTLPPPEFPSPPECEVVSICAVAVAGAPERPGADADADVEKRSEPPAHGVLLKPYVFGRGMTEERRVWAFARLVTRNPGVCIVTWNGRGFDLPVIAARLFRYGWPSPHFTSDYRYRYAKRAAGAHWDLMDLLSDYGAARRAKLGAFARCMGLPGKAFGDGADVARQHAEGLLEEIDFYCLTDVVQTAMVLQRYLVLCGEMSREDYRLLVRSTMALVGGLFAGQPINAGRLFLDRIKS